MSRRQRFDDIFHAFVCVCLVLAVTLFIFLSK